jgi:hypothetical protein
VAGCRLEGAPANRELGEFGKERLHVKMAGGTVDPLRHLRGGLDDVAVRLCKHTGSGAASYATSVRMRCFGAMVTAQVSLISHLRHSALVCISC